MAEEKRRKKRLLLYTNSTKCHPLKILIALDSPRSHSAKAWKDMSKYKSGYQASFIVRLKKQESYDQN